MFKNYRELIRKTFLPITMYRGDSIELTYKYTREYQEYAKKKEDAGEPVPSIEEFLKDKQWPFEPVLN